MSRVRHHQVLIRLQDTRERDVQSQRYYQQFYIQLKLLFPEDGGRPHQPASVHISFLNIDAENARIIQDDQIIWNPSTLPSSL